MLTHMDKHDLHYFLLQPCSWRFTRLDVYLLCTLTVLFKNPGLPTTHIFIFVRSLRGMLTKTTVAYRLSIETVKYRVL